MPEAVLQDLYAEVYEASVVRKEIVFSRNKKWIAAQSKETLMGMVSRIKKTDIVLLDNLYDIRAKLFSLKTEHGHTRPFKLASTRTNKPFFIPTEMLSKEQYLENYREIKNCIRKINPKAKIFFFSTPVTGFHLSPVFKGKPKRVGIIKRVEAFTRSYIGRNFFSFPAYNFKDEHTNFEKEDTYYHDSVLNAYVRTIVDTVSGVDFEAERNRNFAPLLESTRREIEGTPAIKKIPDAKSDAIHPYSNLPEEAYWRKAVAEKNPLMFEKLYSKRFGLEKEMKVATFGSCFAQHIGRNLRARGVNCLDYEPAPHDMAKSDHEKWGYGLYSGRYGNVYSPRQMRQLFDRAFGRYEPHEGVWEKDGRFYDAFRPTLSPGGYVAEEDVKKEQKQHLKQVRKLFEDLEVLVFTFGLTETWEHKQDGTVYPVCPGVSAGAFDDKKYQFKNLTYSECLADFTYVLEAVKAINSGVKFLFTVSPVPLTATGSQNHVLPATIHSKSILRTVCATLFDTNANVDYFPSFEIVSSYPYRGMFYETNLRNVASAGVDHVMSHFFHEHSNLAGLPEEDADGDTETDAEAVCEDELLYNLG